MRAAPAAALVAVLLGAGCSGPAYVARLGWSEARILLARRPIASLLAEPDLDPALRTRLALVLEVRAFARDRLGLAAGDSYTTFAEVGTDATVWVLSAARRDRLEAHTWWYPIVGRVPYRGFFDRAGAEAAGAALARDGLDVDVRRALAFSTLGWFADPLLSTTAASAPVPLAATVIHELFHATVYVAGQAAFNESAANFVGHRGAVAFFCREGAARGDACPLAERHWTAERVRGRVLSRLAGRLRRLYAAGLPAPAREQARGWLAAKAAAALAARGVGGRDELIPPNNARLLGELLYVTDLGAFDALAPTDAELPAAVHALARMGDAADPFAALARALELQNERAAID